MEKRIDDNKEKFRVISTKVNNETYKLLSRLAKKKGITLYEMFQMVADTFRRYMSDEHNLSLEMEQVMAVFEHMVGWEQALNLADPSANPEIAEATYFLVAKGRKGARASHVSRPYFGEWRQTENVQEILERTLSLLFPQRYKKLRYLAVEMECNSILELIDLMIDAQTIRMLNDEYRKDFEDCERSEYGKKPWDAPFVRKHHKTPDTMRQQTIHFEADDVPEDKSDY